MNLWAERNGVIKGGYNMHTNTKQMNLLRHVCLRDTSWASDDLREEKKGRQIKNKYVTVIKVGTKDIKYNTVKVSQAVISSSPLICISMK